MRQIVLKRKERRHIRSSYKRSSPLSYSSCLIFFCTLIFSGSIVSIVNADENDKRNPSESKSIRLSSSHIDFSPFLDDLSRLNSTKAAKLVTNHILSNLEERMSRIFEKATSAECRAKIGTHFGYFVNAIGKEYELPFANFKLQNTCPEEPYNIDNLPDNTTFTDVMNRVYQPPREEVKYIDKPENLKLLYGILTHASPGSTIRLIEALYENGHLFVIHVDGKEICENVYSTLVEYARTRDHVYIVLNQYRVRVNWGGFSMVNAT